jgi:hypothetical protein
MRHQWTEVDGFVFIEGDAIEVRQAGDINQGLDAFMDTSFEFEHQVSSPGYKAGFFTFFGQEAQSFFKGGGDKVLCPHAVIKPQRSARYHLALLD